MRPVGNLPHPDSFEWEVEELAGLEWLEERWGDAISEAPDGCVVFDGPKSRGGYIQVRPPGGPSMPAHRLAYGPHRIPCGWHVDHLCRNRKCLNPRHLEAVPHEENQSRKDPDYVHWSRYDAA